MPDFSSPRLTPWVGRLLAINAIVLLAQQTVFTSETLGHLVAFNPDLAFARPWTFITYMFVHAGIFHLAANSLALFTFGPPVERRLGSTTFLVYYLYCGIGAAAFSLGLQQLHITGVEEIVGASGAIIGVAFAFARMFPDTPLLVMFIPAPIKAKWVIALLLAYDLVGVSNVFNDHVAHSAHLGGFAAGAFYFLLRNIARPADVLPMPAMRPRVPVAARGVTSGGGQQSVIAIQSAPAVQAASAEQQRGLAEGAELDRVLDKISASGIDSLTADERRFLDSVAQRRRDLPH